MAALPEKTVILGAEHDSQLREALCEVLTQLDAKGLERDWGVGGSQELETVKILVGAEHVVIEAETYVGISIRGPSEVVDRIRTMVAAAMK